MEFEKAEKNWEEISISKIDAYELVALNSLY